MNRPFAFLILATLLSCGAKKAAFVPTETQLLSDCPKQSECEITLLHDKKMAVRQDENGAHYYTLEDAPGKNVMIYKFNRIVKGNIQDGGYREEIVFEINSEFSDNLTDSELQNTKMLFGRFCFCKGQTGYYPVRKGSLLVSPDHEATLDFSVPEVPQVIRQIRFSLK